MSGADPILLAHVAATWLMVGLIWFVQLVHYPLMAGVGDSGWVEYERQHTGRTTWIVAPAMLTELVTGVFLILPDAVGGAAGAKLQGSSGLLPWVGLGLLFIVWGSTFFVQVPLHARLSGGFDGAVHTRLVRSNWIRTLAWSFRGLVVLGMLGGSMGAA